MRWEEIFWSQEIFSQILSFFHFWKYFDQNLFNIFIVYKYWMSGKTWCLQKKWAGRFGLEASYIWAEKLLIVWHHLIPAWYVIILWNQWWPTIQLKVCWANNVTSDKQHIIITIIDSAIQTLCCYWPGVPRSPCCDSPPPARTPTRAWCWSWSWTSSRSWSWTSSWSWSWTS